MFIFISKSPLNKSCLHRGGYNWLTHLRNNEHMEKSRVANFDFVFVILQSPPRQTSITLASVSFNFHPQPQTSHTPKMSVYWWALRMIQSFEVPHSPIPSMPWLTVLRTTSSHRYEIASRHSESNANDLQILRRPGFHRAVGKIHKTINEKQYGRNPHEPLAPGEATGSLPRS